MDRLRGGEGVKIKLRAPGRLRAARFRSQFSFHPFPTAKPIRLEINLRFTFVEKSVTSLFHVFAQSILSPAREMSEIQPENSILMT